MSLGYNGTVTHLSIVIVHYNTKTETLRCLESVFGASFSIGKKQVIVVDNGSLESFACPEYPEAIVLRSDANLGFTGGNNLGIHFAIETFNSDYVFLLNSDAVIAQNTLELLCRYSSQTPKAGIICPLIYFTEGQEFYNTSYTRRERGRVIWYGGGSVDTQLLDGYHRYVDEVDIGQVAFAPISEFATGCAALITREVLEKVGLFDKRYFLYLEDLDYSSRARHFGYEVHCCTDAYAWHDNGGSSGVGSPLQQYYMTRNRFLYFWPRVLSYKKRFTLVRLAIRIMLFGSRYEKLGVLHACMGQWGKQPIL